MTDFDSALDYFRKQFGDVELCVKAPSRINIIGEHIDYCGAKVLPFASEPCMYLFFKRSVSEDSEVHAYDMRESISLSEELQVSDYSWANYLIRINQELVNRFNRSLSVELVFTSSIPIGAGMSSSSALCCAYVYGLNKLYDLGLELSELVEISSNAEYGVGLKGGRMDQYTIVHGIKDHALLLDCKTESHEAISLDPNEWNFILINSNVKHELTGSPYNERREQLDRSFNEYKRSSSHRGDILDVDEEDLESFSHIEYIRRLKHVASEKQRVIEATSMIKNCDKAALGKLMFDSHESLRYDYEVSCEEIDFLIKGLREIYHIYGARIMGGGFGGSIICLVSKDFRANELKELFDAYHNRYKIQANIIRLSPEDGLTEVNS